MAQQNSHANDIAIAQAEAVPASEEPQQVPDRSTLKPRRVSGYSRSPREAYGVYAVQLGALVLEILLGFRIFLKLIDANPDSGFAWFVYGVTGPFLAPFSGLIQTPEVNGSEFEIFALIAILAYAILFWLILKSWRLISAW